MEVSELIQGCENELINLGFVKNGECLESIIRKKVGEVIINGQHQDQVQEVKVQFKYIGDGGVDDEPMVGYTRYVNDRMIDDIWVSNPKDITSMFTNG